MLLRVLKLRQSWASARLLAGQHLVKLDLSDNPMTAEVASALAEALRSQQSLQVLNLNDTALGDEGMESIAEVRE
jgi:large subunit ribosomal protein L31/Ran GTPase-activating protein 1